MRYVAAGMIVFVLCSCAWAGAGNSDGILHKLELQVNANVPFTNVNRIPDRTYWHEQISFGLDVEFPLENYAALQLNGDYLTFKYHPAADSWEHTSGFRPNGRTWFADVMLNLKWHFTKRYSSIRPFLIGGTGWLWGRHASFFYGEGGYSQFTEHDAGIGIRGGVGLVIRLSERASLSIEANGITYLDRSRVEFYPLRIGLGSH
jgi:hypothetical protein